MYVAKSRVESVEKGRRATQQAEKTGSLIVDDNDEDEDGSLIVESVLSISVLEG